MNYDNTERESVGTDFIIQIHNSLKWATAAGRVVCLVVSWFLYLSFAKSFIF